MQKRPLNNADERYQDHNTLYLKRAFQDTQGSTES